MLLTVEAKDVGVRIDVFLAQNTEHLHYLACGDVIGIG